MVAQESIRFVYEPRVRITMRDGVRLSASVLRPESGAVPALLVRTPYGIETPASGMDGNGAAVPSPLALARAGFAVVWCEVRGTGTSEGDFRPFVDDAQDGWDTADWLVGQDWCDGAIGAYGASYLTMMQWALAASGHPAVKAIIPTIGTMRWYDGMCYHPGGAMSLSAVTAWHATMALDGERRRARQGAEDVSRRRALERGLATPLEFNDGSPLATHPLLAGEPSFDAVVSHPERDDHWSHQNFSAAVSDMSPPALFIAGWFDVFLREQLKDFRRYVAGARSVEARRGSRLIVGPWDHRGEMTGRFVERDFGAAASAAGAGLTDEHAQHFVRWLRHDRPAQVEPPPVRVFVMGVDRWIGFSAWPPDEASPEDLYLGADADGRPSLAAAPSERDRRWTVRSDPSDPVPTVGGAHLPTVWGYTGPSDRSALDGRHDILRFLGPTISGDLAVIGPISATLHVATDGPDADVVAALIDVHPDGRALVVSEGVQRLRYRESTSHPRPTVAGRIYEVCLDLGATAHVFRGGHRIRLDIAGSSFPRYDRNTHTGGRIAAESVATSRVALTSVHAGAGRASRLTLMVAPAHVVAPPET